MAEITVRIVLLILAALPLWLAAAGVRLIHTSDLHACFTAADHGDCGSPLLRIGAAIAEQRRQFGAENCLYIDTGDTMQGTPAGAITHGQAPLRALLAMGCDAWIPGNHDFDFGKAAFQDGAARLASIIICGNLFPVGCSHSWPGWKLFERGGLRIAVIGSTASYLPHWFLPELAAAFRVTTTVSQLERQLPEILAAKPDVIILAVHQGWALNDRRGVNEVAAIAGRFPEIDLILGGHTHRAFPGRRIGVRTWYVQPPPHGQAVGLIDVTAVPGERATRNIVISSRLHYPDASAPESAQLRLALQADFEAARQYEESIVAPAPGSTVTAGGRPGENNAMSELFCAAIQHSTGAQVVLHGVLSRAELHGGTPVTGRMLFAVIPYDNTVVTAHVTAAQLEDIITEQWEQRKVYTYCGLFGATARIDGSGHAHLMSIAGNPPSAARRYLVALNSFTAAGGGRYPVLGKILAEPECETQNTGLLTRTAVQKYLVAHPGLTVTPQQFLFH